MSNHDGSYMLNEVLQTMLEMRIDERIGRPMTLEFVKRVVKIGNAHDGNPGEILEDLEKIGLCYLCLEESGDLENGLCPSCSDE